VLVFACALSLSPMIQLTHRHSLEDEDEDNGMELEVPLFFLVLNL
jgi:hypothetical protein